jgi:phospholipid:diacylglycerol acyltransferase
MRHTAISLPSSLLFPHHSPLPLMSFLHRRFGGNDSSNDASHEAMPDPDRPANLRVVTAEKLEQLKDKSKLAKGKNGSKRRNFWIFGLGGLFGLVVAAFFAGTNDMLDLSTLENMNLDSFMDALPAAFVRDAQQLQVQHRHWNAKSGGG